MKKRAVVLSGGGAKGAYQVGVWKALRKLRFHYQIVTGTSVGALNGMMMVQKDYHRCLKLWSHINFNQLFYEQFPTKTNGLLGKGKVYQKYAVSFFKNGGIDISRFEQLIYRYYRPLRFFRSSIDFGIVTYNLTSRKTLEITKQKMNEKNAPQYIIASASCYPAFPKKKIDGEYYIDGGYSDNLPINLAISLGATEIIAVDLNAIGVKRKVKNKNVKITYIEPKHRTASILVFEEELSRKSIQYGYYDTMKAFGKLEGNLYTFYPKQLLREYEDNKQKLEQMIQSKLQPSDHSPVFEQLLKLSVFHKLLKDETGEKKKQLFYEIVELLGISLKIDDTKIYKMKDFAKEILYHFSTVESTDTKQIEEKIKQKKVQSLRRTGTLLHFLYHRMEKIPKNKKEKIEYCGYALLFPKEFIATIYLYLLNEQYHILS